MKTRILSGIAMIPLLALLFFGGIVLCIGVILLAVMALREFYKGFLTAGIKPSFKIGVFATIAICISAYLAGMNLENLSSSFQILKLVGTYFNEIIFFTVIVLSSVYLFKINERKMEDALVTVFGILYIPYLASFVIRIDGVYTAERLIAGVSFPNTVWLIILIAFGTDIFAYFTGVIFGKNKLCPNISPKKTIEGAAGGTVGSIVLCCTFAILFNPSQVLIYGTLGLIGSAIAQVGDLTASIFKRKLGIKDYGNLIPGHGGILDRIDSVLFVAPTVFLYFTLIDMVNLINLF